MTDELPPDVEAPIRWLEDVLAREREHGGAPSTRPSSNSI
jgi:hypothetical protein